MKRIMMVAVMMCLGVLQVMAQSTGQATTKPAAHPAAKPASPAGPKSTPQAGTKPVPKPAANHAAGSGAAAQQPEHAWKAGDQHDAAYREHEEERARALERQREMERAREEQARVTAHQPQAVPHATSSTPKGSETTETPNGTASSASINSPITDSDRMPEGMQEALNSAGKGAATAQGPEGDLKCLGPQKRPCTENIVQFMERKVEEKRSEHRALAEVSRLRLYSPNGMVSCRQKDGNPCTLEQVRALNEHVAQPMMCDLRFEHELPNTNNSATTAGTGAASPNTAHSATAPSKAAASATNAAATSNAAHSAGAPSKTGHSATNGSASSGTTSSAATSAKPK